MSGNLLRLLGHLLSLPGSILAAVGLFSAYAQFSGRQDQYQFVLGRTAAITCILVGLLFIIAGTVARKRGHDRN